MSVQTKLLAIQTELKAPKNQFNSFGKYSYRSCEDILEAVKPLLKKTDSTLTISDEIVEVGGRIYVKATATLFDLDDGTTISNTAFAREANEKKGMDESQVTGTASSYCRKYCLNGLFLIDDTKDADTDEFAYNAKSRPASKPQSNISFDEIRETLEAIDDLKSIDDYAKEVAKKMTNPTEKQMAIIKTLFETRRQKVAQ